MVNRGRSGGCITCKQRRVKCDEAKPTCRRCQGLGVCCEGYDKKPVRLRFKDENYKFYATADCERSAAARGQHAHSRRQTIGILKTAAENGRSIIEVPDEASDGLDNTVAVRQNSIEDCGKTNDAQDQGAVLLPCQLTEPDTAVPFFLWHYASIGRDMLSARGFFEMLVPVYSSQPQDSALSLAVSAVASEILSLWQHRADSFRSPSESYVQAVSRLRIAVQDRTERSKVATLFTVLALQLYENLAAVFGLRPAARIHQDGAVSLLSFVDMSDNSDATYEYIRRFMLHTEIAAALRQKRPLRTVAYSWIGKKDLVAAPDNPSSTLDAIGASVAELQARYVQLLQQSNSTPLLHRTLLELRAEGKGIDEQLLAWAQRVPHHWTPLRLQSGRDIDSSIPTYRSICEAYPSCPVAKLWNLWRFQRLLLVQISLGSLNSVLSSSRRGFTEDRPLDELEELHECKDTVQHLVDSVCYSIPFYLGNRAKPLHIADLTDPEILVPSYHLLPSNGLSTPLPDLKIQCDEHKRHVISQGPWQAMNPLSRLLTLFSEDQGNLIASCLRSGQQEWIRAQFSRVTTLLHLPSVELASYKEVGGTWNWSADRTSDMVSSA